MLFVVADSSVVKAASEDPPLLPEGADGDTETGLPPDPTVPPPDEPQRLVEPGTVTQGWENVSIASQIVEQRQVRLIENETRLLYETSYGNFFLSKDSPYFVGVSGIEDTTDKDKVAETAFLVMSQGVILEPANGKIDSASPELLVLHYQLRAGARSAGRLNVMYKFYDDRDKISASFVPSIGLPRDFQVVWLTFTSFNVVDVTTMPAGVEQRFEDLKGYSGSLQLAPNLEVLSAVGMPSTTVRPSKGADLSRESRGLRLNADDAYAAGDWAASYAGKLAFGRRSGNAVLTVFVAGHLTIDPQLLYSGKPQDATSYSGIQRKTFYDGGRYWSFWKDSSTTVLYQSSVNGRNWGTANPAVTATGFAYSFTVANFGKTVAVLWTDNADGNTIKAIRIRTGLIAQDAVVWDDAGTTGRQLYSGTDAIRRPVSATFTSQGSQFGVTWSDTSGKIGFARYTCTGQGTSGVSPCATQAQSGSIDLAGGASGGYQYSLVTSFSDGSGDIARFKVDSVPFDDQSYIRVKIYRSDETSCGDGVDIAHTTRASGDVWMDSGLFTAAASGSGVTIFFEDTGTGVVSAYNVDKWCGASQDALFAGASGSPTYLTAGTEMDSQALYLFFVQGGTAQYMRVIPNNNLFGPYAIPTLAGYTSPYYLTAAQSAIHFIPLMFTRAYPGPTGDSCAASWCLYYVNYPLPLNGEAAVTNPWATKMGAPFVTETGGVVNPTNGLMATGQVLIGGKPSVGLIYREPGRLYWDATGQKDKNFDGIDITYRIMPGIYYDLPWISGTVLHMQGGQTFPLSLTGTSGNLRWFNITRGMRYTLKYDAVALQYTLTFPSGAYVIFNGGATFGYPWRAYLDTTGQNYLTYTYVNTNILSQITDSSGRWITSTAGGLSPPPIGYVSTSGGQTVKLAVSLGNPPGCSGGDTSDSGTLNVIDPIGRTTIYYVCKWRLTQVFSPNGGRADYTYGDYSLGQQVWQGTEVYSLPLLKIDVYNESGANVKARSLAFSWNYQNGEAVRALVNTTDKSGAVQGTNEYVFNSAIGTAIVRTSDSAGQVLYYDMDNLNGALMKDLSGNAKDGTITGTVSVAGKIGRARSFNGAGDRITSSATIPDSKSITVSLWANRDPTQADAEGVLVKKESAFSVMMLSTGYVKAYFYDGTSWQLGAGSMSAVPATAWKHIVVVFAGADTTTATSIYFDGALDTSSTASGAVAPSNAPVTVGGLSATSQRYKGVLDEVHVFTRVLSAEDAGVLWSKNALKRGDQQNWYSINDQPHLVEGFIGDETKSTVVTQDLVDDWGNQIYYRDALGSETFASFANTNHQNHFYAPGSLTKSIGTQFDTEFIDFSEGSFPAGQGVWTVASNAATPTQIDYGTFDKITPSLKINGPVSGTTKVDHPILAGPRFVEFNAKVSTGARFDVRLGSSAATYLGMSFTGAQTIMAWDNSPAPATWVDCYYPGGSGVTYTVNTWYRFTIEIDADSSGRPWKLYLDGIDLNCGSLTSDSPPSQITFETFLAGTWSAWVDDIKIYGNNCQTNPPNSNCYVYHALDIGFDGLKPRQSIQLLAEDGSAIDQQMQTIGNTLNFLSFNSATTGAYKYYESGHNARTTVRIYAEDGTLEYQSPLTRFFVGEQYTYSRPKAFADELIKTRSGAVYWPNITSADYADEPGFCNPANGINCYDGTGTWEWRAADLQGAQTISALRGSYVHVTKFDYGFRDHYFVKSSATSVPYYFTTYVRIPEGKAPDGIVFAVHKPPAYWKNAYWGSPGLYGTYNMGQLPSARDQWIQLVVRATDIGLTPGVDTWDAIDYGLSGGEAEWDVTTEGSSTISFAGLSPLGTALTVGVFYAENGTLIASGNQNGDTASVDLYSTDRRSAFPISAKIKIYDASNEYYFGPARNVWLGDKFRFVGQSSFFDSKSSGAVYWPLSSIHTAQIGAKKFTGDCLDSVLCYDMETLSEGAPVLDSGEVPVALIDLSGKANTGIGSSSYPGVAQYLATDDFSTDPFVAPARWVSADGPACVGYDDAAKNVRLGVLDFTCFESAGITAVSTHNFTQADSFHMDFVATFQKAPGTSGEGLNHGQFGFVNNVYDPWPDVVSFLLTADYSNSCLRIRPFFRFSDGTEQEGTATACSLSWGTQYAGHVIYFPGNTTLLVSLGSVQTSLVQATGKTFRVDRSFAWVLGHLIKANVDDIFPIVVTSASEPTTSIGAAGDAGRFVRSQQTSLCVPDSPTLKFGAGDFTISLWFRPASLPPAGQSWELLGKRVIGGGIYEVRVEGNTSSVQASVGSDPGYVTLTSAAALTVGTLYHVAIARTSGSISLYINGVIAASGTNSQNTDSPSALCIGQDPVSGYGRYFDGTIDQVILYSLALSPTRISALFYTRMPGAPQTYMRFQSNGFPITTRVPYESTYLYSAATYDAKGNVLSISDVGRALSGGTNTTTYVYSTLDGQDYLTKAVRPDSKEIYYAYDFQTGVKYGTLDIDCRRSRIQYDAIGRPVSSSVFDTDPTEILHLDMDTMTGSSPKDVSCAGTTNSASGQSITMGGATTEMAGIDGSSRDFSGSADYLQVPSLSSPPTTALTLSAWINPDTIPAGASRIIELGDWNSAGTALLFVDASGFVRFGRSSPDTQIASNSAIATGTWTFVAGTWDGSTMRLYINGIQQTQTAGFTAAITGTKLTVAGQSARFDGKLDEVRVFKTALSAPDISNLWRFKYKLLARSSVAYDDMTANPAWAGYQFTSTTTYDAVSIPRRLFVDMETRKLNAVAGKFNDLIEDLSGNGNHVENFGATVSSGSANCKIGACYLFGGVSSYVEAKSSASLNIERELSASAWIKVDTSGPTTQTVFAKGQSGTDLQYDMYVTKSGTKWYLKVDLKNSVGTTATATSVQITTGSLIQVGFTYDGNTLQAYVNGATSGTAVALVGPLRTTSLVFRVGHYAGSSSYFKGQIDELQIFDRSFSSLEMSGLYAGAGSEKSHMSKSYQDGLGRSVRIVTMDMFGTKASTVATLGWNDKPVYSHITSGGYFAYTYDFLGRTVTTQTPASAKFIDTWIHPVQGTSTYYNTWGAATGCTSTTHYDCVNDDPNDGDTSYVQSSTASQKESHLMEDVPIPAGYTDIDVTWEASCRRSASQAGGEIAHLIRETDGTAEEDVGADKEFVCPNSATYTVFSYFMEQSPGGGEWTPAEVNALECGYRSSTDVSPAPRVSTVRCRVQVTYPSETGTSVSVASEKARMIESIDPVGRKAYVRMDLLGRTAETAVWNPGVGVYGNFTATTYNALSKLVTSTDAKGQKTTLYYSSAGMLKMTVFADGTSSLVYYDDNLRAFKTVDVMGRISTTAYDNVGRVTSVILKASETGTPYAVSFGYDPIHGDLQTIDNGTAKITRGYDALHRMVAERLEVPAGTVIGTLGYGYDAVGNVLNITYPVAGLPEAVYAYDSLARPVQVDYGGSKYAVLTYDSFGRLDNIHYWKGATDTTIQEKYSYDARDRATQVKVFNGGTTTYMQLDYVYNKASEIASSTDDMFTGSGGASNPKSATYSYDGNGRLAKAVGPFGASETTESDCYDYDAVGNIAHWRQGTTSCPTSGSGYFTYTVGGWNRLDSLSYNSMSFQWNTAASMTCKTESGSNTRYIHDFQEELVGIKPSSSSCTSTEAPTYTYSYDGLARRVKTVDPSATSYFMYAGNKILYSKVGATETAYVYVGDKLLARKDASAAQPSYYHQDISPGSVRLITYYTTSIQVEAKYRYRAFGDLIVLSGSSQRFQFAQQEYEGSTTRQYHMGLRYQDPVVGRFVQRDPIGPGFSYASNNPISFTDPTGMTSAWGSFINWIATPEGRTTVNIVLLAVAVATSIPSGGGSLAIYAVVGGLIVGTIFVAYTYVASGGQATFDDYVNAFALGFTIGAVIGGGAYSAFRVLGGAPELGAAKAAAAIQQTVKTDLLSGERLAGSEADDIARAVAKDLKEVPIDWTTTAGSAADLAQTNLRVHVAAEQSVRDYLATGRAAFESRGVQGTRIHRILKGLIEDDPFLKSRVLYNSKGIDVVYQYGSIKWELTTFRQVDAHILRFTTTSGLDGFGNFLATKKDILDIIWLLY